MTPHFITARRDCQRISIALLLGIAALMLPCLIQTSRSQGKHTTPSIAFLTKNYRLGSFNQKQNPMWEFVTGGETVNNWTTLMTIVDRPDAHTRHELDLLAEGVMDAYKTKGGKVLKAQTMQDSSGTPYNYMVVAFDEPGQHRYELNFVKAATGKSNCYLMIYGVRISDEKDYVTKAKIFLTAQSGEIGRALEKTVPPDINGLPRREF